LGGEPSLAALPLQPNGVDLRDHQHTTRRWPRRRNGHGSPTLSPRSPNCYTPPQQTDHGAVRLSILQRRRFPIPDGSWHLESWSSTWAGPPTLPRLASSRHISAARLNALPRQPRPCPGLASWKMVAQTLAGAPLLANSSIFPPLHGFVGLGVHEKRSLRGREEGVGRHARCCITSIAPHRPSGFIEREASPQRLYVTAYYHHGIFALPSLVPCRVSASICRGSLPACLPRRVVMH
jgi:hypothetical protein